MSGIRFLDDEPAPKAKSSGGIRFLDDAPAPTPEKKSAPSGNILQRVMPSIKQALSSFPGMAPVVDPKAAKEVYQASRVPVEYVKEKASGLVDKIPDPQTRSTAANIALGIPKFGADVAAEVIPELFLSPEALAMGGYGMAARAAKPQITSAIEIVGKYAPVTMKRALAYRWNQPEAYKLIAEGRQRAMMENAEKGIELAKDFAKISSKDQRTIGAFLRGEVPPPAQAASASELILPPGVAAPVKRGRGRPPKKKPDNLASPTISDEAVGMTPAMREMAEKVRKEFVTLGEEAVDLGLLARDTYIQNIGRYLPRMYRFHELPRGMRQNLTAQRPTKVHTDRFKKRQDIPKDVREAMGEILEAGYPTVKGLTQLRNAVVTARMFRTVARNPEWSLQTTVHPTFRGRGVPKTKSAQHLQEEAAITGFTKIPEGKAYGELSGRYVHPEIAHDILEITRQKGAFERVYGSFLKKWKFGKVVLNPATHMRNIFSNTVMMDMAGINHIQQIPVMTRALAEMRKRGNVWKEAKDAGLLGQEFFGGELTAFQAALLGGRGQMIERIAKYSERTANILNKMQVGTAKAANALGRVYQSEDQIFKLGMFMHLRNKGMNVTDAVKETEKYIFNYSKVSPFVQKARSTWFGSPFITFASKALPRVAATAVFNPLRLYKYKLMGDAFKDITQERLGVDDDEIDIIKRNARGTVLILPWRDQNGDLLTLDLSYILPWGDIGETGGLFGLPPIASPSGPAKIVTDIGYNKSTFTGEQIWNPDIDPPHVIVSKAIDYIGKGLLPSFMPGVHMEESAFKGGYSFQKIVDGIRGRPDYFGRVRTLPYVLADVLLGLKTTPVDVAMQEKFEIDRKRRAENELKAEMRRLLRHQGVSDRYKDKIPDIYVKRLERIWKDVVDFSPDAVAPPEKRP